jgi:hypothetical protein
MRGNSCKASREQGVTSARLMVVSAEDFCRGLGPALSARPDLARPNLAGVKSWNAARAALCIRRCAGAAVGDARSGAHTISMYNAQGKVGGYRL